MEKLSAITVSQNIKRFIDLRSYRNVDFDFLQDKLLEYREYTSFGKYPSMFIVSPKQHHEILKAAMTSSVVNWLSNTINMDTNSNGLPYTNTIYGIPLVRMNPCVDFSKEIYCHKCIHLAVDFFAMSGTIYPVCPRHYTELKMLRQLDNARV
jgi:hypothetical protein